MVRDGGAPQWRTAACILRNASTGADPYFFG